jgi:hypothetical protein
VPRIPFDAGFQMLLATGLTPDAAIDALDDETKRTAGKLDLWCNGNKLPRHYIRQSLRIVLDRARGTAKIHPAGPLGWQQRIESYVFELDDEQMKTLIAKISKRSTPPKKRERPIKPGTRKEWAFGVLRDRIKAGDENPQKTLLKRYREKYGLGQTPLANIQRRFLRAVRRRERGKKIGQITQDVRSVCVSVAL